MKKKDVSEEEEYSADDPDDPEEEANSGDDWTPNQSAGAPKKRPQRATSTKKRHHSEEEEEEEEEDEEEEDEDDDEIDATDRRPLRKRPFRQEEEEEEEEEDDDSDDNNFNDTSGLPPKDFTSGSFVVAKDDIGGDKDPTLWRIDGKALLQKYLPFKEDGKTLYKSTSTYSGWSTYSKLKYVAAKVTFKVQTKQENIVELHLNTEPQQEAAKDEKKE